MLGVACTRCGAALAVAAALTVACVHGPVASSPAAPVAPAPVLPRVDVPDLRFDVGAVDASKDPCQDFYAFACGGWKRSHPIPPERAQWGRYEELMQANVEREKAIVAQAVEKGASGTAGQRRIGAFYTSCMDEASLEARGIAAIKPLLDRIDAIRTGADAASVLAEMLAHGMSPLLDLVVDADLHDSSVQTLDVDRGFVGMRSVGVYGKSDDRSKALRASYREHLVRVFTLLGGSPADAGADADRVLGLETSLTSRALSPVQERDTEGHDHLLDAAALRARFPVVDLPSLVAKMGAVLDRANVSAMAWVGAVDATLAGADLAGVRAYLRAYVARDFAESLPSAFARERFDWERHTLRGIQKMDTRADRCLALLDGNVGEDVGRIFVERYYDTATRHLMDGMIARVQGALRNEIRSSDWLSPAAKAAADEKLRRVLVVTGASNRLRNLDGVAIEPGDLFGDVWRSRAAATAYELARLSRPTDREEFFDSLPQEFDGFGSKRTNTMGFTAGILQPPVLDPRVDDAVNYGGLGSVIGHELSHLLDDEGRKYDASGNVRPWWSPEDVANFEKRAKCFQDEYDQFHGDEGTKLDGKLTLGENLGDNDGIRASYDALHPSETGPRVDGYTPAQRFFLAWGQIRCQSLTPEREHDLIVDNPHAPGHWRVDGVVVNMPEFASAFACAAGTPMAPASRCRLW